MKKLFLALILVTCNLAVWEAQAQTSPDYKKALSIYFSNAGSLASIETMFEQMSPMLGVDGLSEEKKKEIIQRSMDAMIDLLVPEYQKYVSIEDLKAMNEFYETPLGKRMAEAAPKLMGCVSQVGQQWGIQLMQIVQDVKSK